MGVVSFRVIPPYGVSRESLRSDVFERRTLTGSGLFAHLSCDFEQTFGQIVSIRVKTLSNTNLVRQGILKEKKKLASG